MTDSDNEAMGITLARRRPAFAYEDDWELGLPYGENFIIFSTVFG